MFARGIEHEWSFLSSVLGQKRHRFFPVEMLEAELLLEYRFQESGTVAFFWALYLKKHA